MAIWNSENYVLKLGFNRTQSGSEVKHYHTKWFVYERIVWLYFRYYGLIEDYVLYTIFIIFLAWCFGLFTIDANNERSYMDCIDRLFGKTGCLNDGEQHRQSDEKLNKLKELARKFVQEPLNARYIYRARRKSYLLHRLKEFFVFALDAFLFTLWYILLDQRFTFLGLTMFRFKELHSEVFRSAVFCVDTICLLKGQMYLMVLLWYLWLCSVLILTRGVCHLLIQMIYDCRGQKDRGIFISLFVVSRDGRKLEESLSLGSVFQLAALEEKFKHFEDYREFVQNVVDLTEGQFEP